MSTASPTAFLLWAILSVLFLGFMVHHLWCYDRFKCLRWSGGRQPGAFKRVMTYSYLSSVPLFIVYSVAMTVIKFRQGFVLTPPPDVRFIPTPIDIYDSHNRRWIVPLNFIFSMAWGLELVTHLEELTFWLYLLHQTPQKEAWFSSWEYHLWYFGSIVAIVGMPLVVLIARHNLVTIDAYIFLAGASGSTSTTLAFMYVLWRFPRFIRHVRAEGADPTVVVRLATFYSLHLARVVFRFMFTLPLMVVALDGIIGSVHYINTHLFWTDFFQMIAGVGCFVSSAITLLIFFPRSIVRESGYKPRLSSSAPASPKSPTVPPGSAFASPARSPPPSGFTSPPLALRMTLALSDTDSAEGESESEEARAPPYVHLHHRHTFPAASPGPMLALDPARIHVALPPSRPVSVPHAALHPYVMTFTSPIDLVEIPPADSLSNSL